MCGILQYYLVFRGLIFEILQVEKWNFSGERKNNIYIKILYPTSISYIYKTLNLETLLFESVFFFGREKRGSNRRTLER